MEELPVVGGGRWRAGAGGRYESVMRKILALVCSK